MVDHSVSAPANPVTAEAFLADRQKIYGTFIGMSKGATIFLVILLVLMAYFLV